MATLTSPHIPVAFRLPRDADAFRGFAASHPEVSWVTKSNHHRGIRLQRDPEEIIKNVSSSSASSVSDVLSTPIESFVQEFVDKPLLVDNRKFDIGVYVVITSVRQSGQFILSIIYDH